jgi:hypothetical protein
VRRRELGSPAGSLVYELTNWGRLFEPHILQASRWAAASRWLQAHGDVLGHPLSVPRLRAGQTSTDADAASLMPPCVLVN